MLMYLLPNDKLIRYQNQWYDNTLSQFVRQNQIDNLNTSYKLIYSVSHNTTIDETVALNIDLLSKSSIIINIDGATSSSSYRTYTIKISNITLLSLYSRNYANKNYYWKYLICNDALCQINPAGNSDYPSNYGYYIGQITENTLSIQTYGSSTDTYTVKIYVA